MTEPDASLVAAVRAIETKSTGWLVKLLVMGVSLALFVALGMAWWNVRLVWMLVVILLVHESGHYLAMRWFGYRNVKMFFIPMLGAAVSGRHFNIAGWKKAIVYLAGPLPGVVLSIPLMIAGLNATADGDAGLAINQSWMLELGGLALLLNVMNLLPLMPLDGGWILQLTVFCRSPLLELASRVLAIVAMSALGLWLGDPVLLVIVVPLLLALPLTYRTAKLIGDLRGQPMPPPTADEIPEEAVALIGDSIDRTSLSAISAKQKAPLVVQIYESLIVQPPGVTATLGIWSMYLGSFAVALLGGWGVWASRQTPDASWDESFFDSVQQSVELPADALKFHLGLFPINESELAVVTFADVDDANAALNRFEVVERALYSHVAIGKVVLASVPKRRQAEPADDWSGDVDRVEVDGREEDRFAARMKQMVQPTDPATTWLAPWLTARFDSALSPRIDIISGFFGDSIQLRATAPDADTANRIATEVFQVPAMTANRLYVPVWSPLDAPTPSQLACRDVLERLIDGITPETSPELFARKEEAYRQVARVDGGQGRRVVVSEMDDSLRQLESEYIDQVLASLDGPEAEVGRMYRRYQKALHAYFRDQMAGIPGKYPTLDQFLGDTDELLGFSRPDRKSHHYAAHVTGNVLSASAADRSGDRDGDADDVFDRRLNMSIHRATDQAATVAALITFLRERGFTNFELRYVTPAKPMPEAEKPMPQTEL